MLFLKLTFFFLDLTIANCRYEPEPVLKQIGPSLRNLRIHSFDGLQLTEQMSPSSTIGKLASSVTHVTCLENILDSTTNFTTVLAYMDSLTHLDLSRVDMFSVSRNH